MSATEPRDIRNASGELIAIARKSCAPSAEASEQAPGALPDLPEPDGSAEVHVKGDEYTEVDAWSEPLVREAQRAAFDAGRLEGRRDQHETNLALVNENCALVEKLRARIDAGSGAVPAPAKKAHGHRDDYYLMANCRLMLGQKFARIENWVIAMKLFATGSTSAHQICVDAGFDPSGKKIQRAAPSPDVPAGEGD